MSKLLNSAPKINIANPCRPIRPYKIKTVFKSTLSTRVHKSPWAMALSFSSQQSAPAVNYLIL